MFFAIQVHNDSFDIGLAQLTMNPLRTRLVDFTNQIAVVDIVFKSGLPKEIVSFTVLLEPFDRITWELLLASSVLVAMFLLASDKLYWTTLKGRMHIGTFTKSESFSPSRRNDLPRHHDCFRGPDPGEPSSHLVRKESLHRQARCILCLDAHVHSPGTGL